MRTQAAMRTHADGRTAADPGLTVVDMADDDSRATWVLRYVVSNPPPSQPANGHLRVLDSWVDGDAVCLVYTGWWQEGPIGLRRVVEPDVPMEQIALYVLIAELGEPPGLSLAHAQPDADGVRWWGGHEPAWREYDL